MKYHCCLRFSQPNKRNDCWRENLVRVDAGKENTAQLKVEISILISKRNSVTLRTLTTILQTQRFTSDVTFDVPLK